ncbi:MAG TPA: SAM-dependent methyltransferase [Desulfobulbus sp.]|nr:SAM-dependent methyltransferase [Desulfobulbus sp.]
MSESRSEMKEQQAVDVDVEALVQGYDGVMFNPALHEYLGNSDFLNYGYWDESTTNQKEASERLMEKLIALIPEKQGPILDVACGMGASTRYLMRYYRPEEIYAINISARQLARASEKAPGCTFREMNATRLDFRDCFFGSVLCVEAAFHFETRLDFFREAYRVLRPGGTLVLSDILMHREAEERRSYRTVRNYVPDLDAYAGQLQQAGFRRVSVEDVTVPCWHGHYWSVVNYFHQKFLTGELDYEGLQYSLDRTYKVVGDIDYYILAAGHKP